MDVMRLDFYRNDPASAHSNPEAVFFKVAFLKVHGDWALVDVEPVNAADKIIAEPRWGLLRRKFGRWVDEDYEKALNPYPLDEFDAIDMTPKAIQYLWRAFPDVPRDIFPNLIKHQ
jgi:hypothetical protein